MIGLGIAWRAAQAGLRVTVVDQAPGRGASWAAAGMLAPVTEVHYGERPLLGLNLAAAGRWPSFAAEVEEAAAARSATVPPAPWPWPATPMTTPPWGTCTGSSSAAGWRSSACAAASAGQLEPGLPEHPRRLLAAGDHQVDNRALVEALLVACQRAGSR